MRVQPGDLPSLLINLPLSFLKKLAKTVNVSNSLVEVTGELEILVDLLVPNALQSFDNLYEINIKAL